MNNREADAMAGALVALSGEQMHPKLAYAINVNHKRLTADAKRRLEVLETVRGPTLNSYLAKSNALALEHAVKDEHGVAQIHDGPHGPSYRLEDQAAFEAAHAKLRSELPSLDEELASYNRQVASLSEQESVVSLHRVSVDYLPNPIAPSMIGDLLPMLIAGDE